MTIGDIAGDTCRIFSLRQKCTAVKSAGRYTDLFDAAVGSDLNFLGAGLSAVVGLVRESVIKNIPLTVYTFDTAVSRTRHIELVGC